MYIILHINLQISSTKWLLTHLSYNLQVIDPPWQNIKIPLDLNFNLENPSDFYIDKNIIRKSNSKKLPDSLP